MAAAKKRRIAAVTGDGRITLVEQDVPELKPGAVLVDVHASLVSPGTELGGWRALHEKKKNPDTEAEPRPFGYSNAGVVLDVGQGVEEFQAGERIACVGYGHASHTDCAVVPHHLCVPLPDNVTFAQGSYGMLAATAMQALRRGEARLGEYAAVVGLGIVGQLAAQLYTLAGAYVIGWETIPLRTEMADKWGIAATVTAGDQDVVEATQSFTGGMGLDEAVVAFGGDANLVMENIEKSMKLSPDGHRMGVVVMVGAPRFEYTSGTTNIDYRRAARTGPGYHDAAWEFGPDYPPVFMRWTTQTNLKLCMRLISEGRLDVDCLTTHTIPLNDVEEGIDAAMENPDGILGVVFTKSA